MTMLAQKPKQLFRSPFEHPLLAPGQFHGRIPHRNGHRLLLALCAQAGADHTPGPEVDPQTVTDRNDPAFEPIGALASRTCASRALHPRTCVPRVLALYTEPHGSVCTSPPRCFVRRALGRHPARRSRTARPSRRFDLRPRRQVPHDADGHEEARRRPGAGGARHHEESRARADLQARSAPAGRRERVDRAVPPALGRSLRRVGQGRRGTQTKGEAPMKNPTTTERTSGRELVVTRTLDATARIVFEAWTRPELLKRWWSPKSFGISFLSC